MNCVICKHGETMPGTTNVTLERGKTTLVIKAVPARVCSHCGEVYFDTAVTDALLTMMTVAVQAGVQVEVRTFALAEVS
ncbi:MAG: type II toxin-antitoxin system MqsA family antitoxin [Armatimonadetes bacterium]|nr:type II toxin-antitoxin system MqsA family antitoxin [Anaerolineae bacterium]